MPRRKKEVPSTPAIAVSAELLDQLVSGPMNPHELESMVRGLKKAVVERALGAELTHDLGYPKGRAPPVHQANCRNGSTPMTVLTNEGPLDLAIPRDGEGSYEPRLIGKGERRFTGFDDKIIAMRATPSNASHTEIRTRPIAATSEVSRRYTPVWCGHVNGVYEGEISATARRCVVSMLARFFGDE